MTAGDGDGPDNRQHVLLQGRRPNEAQWRQRRVPFQGAFFARLVHPASHAIDHPTACLCCGSRPSLGQTHACISVCSGLTLHTSLRHQVGPGSASWSLDASTSQIPAMIGVLTVFCCVLRQVPCSSIANRYPFRMGCIADVGQTFNSSATLTHMQARPAAWPSTWHHSLLLQAGHNAT